MSHRSVLKATVFVLCLAGSLFRPDTASCQAPARLFVTGNDVTILLHSTNLPWCVNVEPIGGSFDPTDVDLTSVVLISPGTGSVSQISAITKTAVVADEDGNGINEIIICFERADLRDLFSNLHGKKPKTVDLTLEGNLYSGGSFSGNLTIDVYPLD